MIDDITDYKYVSGPLSEIKIDGGIMPLRSGDDKKILRGEDITFLMETLRRRTTYSFHNSRAIVKGEEKWSFSMTDGY